MTNESDYIKCPKCKTSIYFQARYNAFACSCDNYNNNYYQGFWFDMNILGSFEDNLFLSFDTMKVYEYPLRKFILQVNDENISSLYNKFCETKSRTEKDQLINQLFKEFYNNYILKIKDNLIFE